MLGLVPDNLSSPLAIFSVSEKLLTNHILLRILVWFHVSVYFSEPAPAPNFPLLSRCSDARCSFCSDAHSWVENASFYLTSSFLFKIYPHICMDIHTFYRLLPLLCFQIVRKTWWSCRQESTFPWERWRPCWRTALWSITSVPMPTGVWGVGQWNIHKSSLQTHWNLYYLCGSCSFRSSYWFDF